MESSLVTDDFGGAIIDSDGCAGELGESRTDVMAAPAEDITAVELVVCAVGVVVPLPQAASGTVINASRTNERRMDRP